MSDCALLNNQAVLVDMICFPSRRHVVGARSGMGRPDDDDSGLDAGLLLQRC